MTFHKTSIHRLYDYISTNLFFFLDHRDTSAKRWSIKGWKMTLAHVSAAILIEEERTVGWWIVSSFLSIKSIGRLEFRSEVTTRSRQGWPWMRLRERDFWTAADASRGTTTGYERFGRGEAGNVTWWNILLVHPCISPSISLIKRSLLDNFQPRPSLSFIFCSSHFLFPPPRHPPFSSIFVQSSPTACLLHDSGHVLTVRRTNTKQPGSFQNPPFDLV